MHDNYNERPPLYYVILYTFLRGRYQHRVQPNWRALAFNTPTLRYIQEHIKI